MLFCSQLCITGALLLSIFMLKQSGDDGFQYFPGVSIKGRGGGGGGGQLTHPPHFAGIEGAAGQRLLSTLLLAPPPPLPVLGSY